MDLALNRRRSGPPRKAPRDAADASYGSGLKWSLIAHGALFTAILVKSLIFPGKPVAYIPTLRVDVVGLPDILKKDLSKLPPLPAPPKPEAKPKSEPKPKEPPKAKVVVPKAAPDEMVLHPKRAAEEAKREKRLRAALDRIKSLEKIDDIKPAAAVIKGNKISKGASLSSDARESDQPNYLDSIREKLQENWALPVWIARQNLSAEVQIFVDARGRITSFSFLKSSGNTQFDEAVKRALSDSQPFPPPPQDEQNALLSRGISVGFPL